MKKIAILFMVLLAGTSCVDLLQKPQSSITPETIELSDQLLESMSNGMYKAWGGENYG